MSDITRLHEKPYPPISTQSEQVADLGFARLDLDRSQRTGDPEVVFAAGKSPRQVVIALKRLAEANADRAVLATRCDALTITECREEFANIDINATAGTAVLGPLPGSAGVVAIVAAGTSDLPVATEAAVTVRVFGAEVEMIIDVGVAGLHRLLAEHKRIERADAVIVVAGMEGALPSVVGGLTGRPLIALPTSIGYGLSMGGLAALLSMLNSCAPGVTVVNVDNGFGAGVAAARIARSIGRARLGAAPAAAAHE